MADSTTTSDQTSPRRRNWIVIFLRTVMVLVLVVVLSRAAIPFITTGRGDAPWSEAEQILGSFGGRARLEYAQNNRQPKRLTEFADEAELAGKYYRAHDRVYLNAPPPYETQSDNEDGYARLVGMPLREGDQWLVMTFAWSSGHSRFEWLDEAPDWMHE